MVWLVALPFFVLVAVAGAGEPAQYWEISSGTTCDGEQKDYEKCPGLPPCTACVKVNCKFTTWGNWEQGPGCSGVCTRSRHVEPFKNKCGDACTGPLNDTKTCLKAKCEHHQGVDCVLGKWSLWNENECKDVWSQKSRTRKIISRARDAGKPCRGQLKETMPCAQPMLPQDCQWGNWSVYTTCSTKCGPGRMTRMRRVHKEARLGGKTCTGSTREISRCNGTSAGCRPAACVMADWGKWKGCDASNPIQRERSRLLAQHATFGGAPCTAHLKELGRCNATTNPKFMCKLTAWSGWTVCDKRCNGGQKTRHRVLENPGGVGNCAIGSVRQLAPCGTGTCLVHGKNDCQLGQWGKWDACSAKCGAGVKIRKRHATSAKGKGFACGQIDLPVALEEVGTCSGSDCHSRDCRWNDWQAWSGCTLSCGGGTQRRHRSVAQSPENKGRACEAKNMSQIGNCSMKKCPVVCINGTFGDWSHWSKVSVTCGLGYRSRTRHVNQEPNECGREVTGLLQEYKSERHMSTPHCVPPIDCKWGEWDKWSACTATCFGISERNRVIEHFTQGEGAPCPLVSTRMIRACNPLMGQDTSPMCMTLTPRRDCIMSEWSAWTPCSKECGKGQRHKVRNINQQAMHSGKACPPDLSMTEGCVGVGGPGKACGGDKTCVDCVMDDWGSWGACTKSGHQKRRTRGIKTQRNQCGKPCEDTTTKQIAECDSTCAGPLYCKWGDWTKFATCPPGCGAATTSRHRNLEISKSPALQFGDVLFQSGYCKKKQAHGGAASVASAPAAGITNIICSGSQRDVQACSKQKKCTAAFQVIDCKFARWSAWTNGTSEGLCSRHRHIGVMNNKHGAVCMGPLVETKSGPECQPRSKDKLDCKLSAFGMWSQCSTPVGQRFRIRSIRQMPQSGGKACDTAALRETSPCASARKSADFSDCKMSEWSAWGRCARTCGSGWRIKTRRIIEPASHGGEPCNNTLDELEACNTQSCSTSSSVDCLLGDWLPWGGCHHHNQRFRERLVSREAQLKGAACSGNMTETAACTDFSVDCTFSDWTPWMGCSMTCRGGTTVRHRQINTWPVNGGKVCPQDFSLEQVRACNDHTTCSASADCNLLDWSAWSKCPTTCGVGQIKRTRRIRSDRVGTGRGCNVPLEETGPCIGNGPCNATDCLWNLWGDWTDCSKKCGGGRSHRTRSIRAKPTHGGAECAAKNKAEMKECSMTKCAADACVNGEWETWEAWAPCSKTCRGGVTWRLRRAAKPANFCGLPPMGKSREVGTCNGEKACMSTVDCKFSDWYGWGGCDKTCDGIMRRSRTISVRGSGDGTMCKGSLKEAAPCHPELLPGGYPGVAPAGCSKSGAPINCEYSVWNMWSACSGSQGGGQRYLNRTVLHGPANGGAVCKEELVRTEGCVVEAGAHPCATEFCVWSSWGSWSACNTCGGQRTRIRDVSPPGPFGGHSCTMRAAEETTGCPVHCHDKFFCAWSNWADWSNCSSACGNAYKSRKRKLSLQNMPAGTSRSQLYEADGAEGELQQRFQQLWRQSKRDEASRAHELLAAFAAGGLGLLIALVLVRVVARPAGAESSAELALERSGAAQTTSAPFLRTEGLE